jgi:hypothetical protein
MGEDFSFVSQHLSGQWKIQPHLGLPAAGNGRNQGKYSGSKHERQGNSQQPDPPRDELRSSINDLQMNAESDRAGSLQQQIAPAPLPGCHPKLAERANPFLGPAV